MIWVHLAQELATFSLTFDFYSKFIHLFCFLFLDRNVALELEINIRKARGINIDMKNVFINSLCDMTR